MSKIALHLTAAFAVLALAGCSNKSKVADIPPPQQAPVEQAQPVTPPPVDTGPAAGSYAEFMAQAGTDTIYFDTDMHDVDSEDAAILTRQAQWLAKYPNISVVVEGHCDERGTREYNLALGDRRANAAKNYLVSQGVDASRIRTISYGKERPAATGSDETSWAQNRRSVTVLPQ